MTITIGSDPEFLLVKNGSVTSAEYYEYFNSLHGPIGMDGAGTPIEIRPRPVPVSDIGIMFQEIQSIFSKIANFCYKNKMDLYAGAGYNGGYPPIGGHIHFGGEEMKKRRRKMLNLLDCYFTPLSNFFISLSDLADRLESGYGQIGSYETKVWGFEYRTPYSFLLSPFTTKALFALAALIAYHSKKLKVDQKLVSDVHTWYDDYLSTTFHYRLYKRIKPVILNLMKYGSPNPEFNSYILSMFSLIEQRRRVRNYSVLHNFGFTKNNIRITNLIFSNDDYMCDIEEIIKKHFKKELQEKIFLYGVAKRPIEEYEETQQECLFLSDALPGVEGMKYVHDTFGSGESHTNSIGLSHPLRVAIKNGDAKYKKILINYLKKL